ncbi:MAG: sigma factor [Thermoguttaceae bacterium]|jgi:RNA polymerase sigma-70 factor (ECF subfamily)
MSKQQPTPEPADAGGFAATHWTVVLAAAGGTESSRAAEAMTELCRTYWYPLYAFLRRRGHESHEAEDLTQEFFARLLGPGFLANVDRRKGKFRSFLLASLKHFLSDQRDRANARKRGGGRPLISLDCPAAETRYRLEPAQDITPEKMFEKQWALSLLERVLSRLQAELAAEGKASLFQALKDTLTGGRSGRYAVIGAELSMSEGAVKTAAHRLRRRYRALFREEIAQTVAGPDEIEDEIRCLLSCL